MKKGTKILMVVGALAVAGTVVLYFVNKKYGVANYIEAEATAPASGCGCGK
jgi:hypothetical protein